MVKFDRLKLKMDVGDVIIKDDEPFQHIVKNGKLCELRYHQSTPFQLGVKLDYLKNEAVIEFTGKVLGKDYPRSPLWNVLSVLLNLGFVSLICLV